MGMFKSQFEYEEFLRAKQQARQREIDSDPHKAPAESVASERRLHEDIIRYCAEQKWIAFHGSMAHRTFRSVGEPDFIILGSIRTSWADGTGVSYEPRVWFIECKTRTGKLSAEQLGVMSWAADLGHTIHVVRSMEDFINVVTEVVRK